MYKNNSRPGTFNQITTINAGHHDSPGYLFNKIQNEKLT